VRVLQLTTSDPFHETGVPDEARSHRIAERMLAEACGEPVETVLRVIWPSPALPDIVDRWMTQYSPNLVVLNVNGYWYLYPSVPLLFERRFGRVGKPLAKAGFSAGRTSWIAQRRLFHWGRWLALRTVGGAYYFTPDEVVDVVTQCVRRILAHENVALVIRGNLLGWSEGPRGAELAVHTALERLAGDLHVTWLARDATRAVEGQQMYQTGDRLHSTVELHRFYGEREGAAMVEAWREHAAAIAGSSITTAG
jgi:hypothetical protein